MGKSTHVLNLLRVFNLSQVLYVFPSLDAMLKAEPSPHRRDEV